MMNTNVEARISEDIAPQMKVFGVPVTLPADTAPTAAATLAYGDHACHVYSSNADRIRFLHSFFGACVARGDKCVYYMHGGRLENTLLLLEQMGFPARRLLMSGAFVIAGGKDLFYSNGIFSPDAVLASYRKLAMDAQSRGYAGVGVVADMEWVLGIPEGSDRMMEYEARMNHQSGDMRAVTVCQYHQGLFQPEIIFNAMQTHPVVIKNGFPRENPYYLEPDVFLASASARISPELLAGAEQAKGWHDKKTIGKARHEFMESVRKFGLTPQEHKVVERILLFRSNQEMAEELYISANTVKQHIKNIYRKMGISKRLELVGQFMKLLEA
ncbi:MAG: MEDS domain-containing protein [Nitrospinae bacterium]|nr:MEDS domain-containing protein [Nitrospinota bacterium]